MIIMMVVKVNVDLKAQVVKKLIISALITRNGRHDRDLFFAIKIVFNL